MDELTIGGKTYVSSKRAAEITGYAKDYVGQLCREGHVEARMVGRSWYVLESSIREHRFGKEEAAEVVEKPEYKPSYTRASWTEATYEAEKAPVIPELTERVSVNVFEMEQESIPEESEADSESKALSDMQAAWREWFNQRQDTVPAPVEEPETVPEDASEREEEETPVTLQRIEEPEEAEEAEMFEDIEPVTINRSYSSMPLDVERSREEAFEPAEDRFKIQGSYEEVTVKQSVAVPVRHKSSLVARTAMLAVAGIAVAVAIVGSGYVGQYTNLGISSPILDYLQGETVYRKTK